MKVSGAIKLRRNPVPPRLDRGIESPRLDRVRKSENLIHNFRVIKSQYTIDAMTFVLYDRGSFKFSLECKIAITSAEDREQFKNC